MSATVILHNITRAEVHEAWVQTGATVIVATDSQAAALQASYRENRDAYLVQGDIFPPRESEYAPYELPQPSPDRIVKPLGRSSPFVNHASFWRGANAKDHMIYPKGFPWSHRFRAEQRYEWSDNRQDGQPGIWCWPTDPPMLDAATRLVLPGLACKGLVLLDENARGFVVPPGAYLPMAGVILIARDAIPFFVPNVVGDTSLQIAAYYAQHLCHHAGRLVGMGLPVLPRIAPPATAEVEALGEDRTTARELEAVARYIGPAGFPEHARDALARWSEDLAG